MTVFLVVGSRWAPSPSRVSSRPSPRSSPHRPTWIKWVCNSMSTGTVPLSLTLCVLCVCCPGAGFLLQSEGAWLSDAKRAGSFGDHPLEPALDGAEPPFTSELALVQSPADSTSPGSGRSCTIVGLCLPPPFICVRVQMQARGWGRRRRDVSGWL